jgi:hypothetical protein
MVNGGSDQSRETLFGICSAGIVLKWKILVQAKAAGKSNPQA